MYIYIYHIVKIAVAFCATKQKKGNKQIVSTRILGNAKETWENRQLGFHFLIVASEVIGAIPSCG